MTSRERDPRPRLWRNDLTRHLRRQILMERQGTIEHNSEIIGELTNQPEHNRHTAIDELIQRYHAFGVGIDSQPPVACAAARGQNGVQHELDVFLVDRNIWCRHFNQSRNGLNRLDKIAERTTTSLCSMRELAPNYKTNNVRILVDITNELSNNASHQIVDRVGEHRRGRWHARPELITNAIRDRPKQIGLTIKEPVDLRLRKPQLSNDVVKTRVRTQSPTYSLEGSIDDLGPHRIAVPSPARRPRIQLRRDGTIRVSVRCHGKNYTRTSSRSACSPDDSYKYRSPNWNFRYRNK